LQICTWQKKLFAITAGEVSGRFDKCHVAFFLHISLSCVWNLSTELSTQAAQLCYHTVLRGVAESGPDWFELALN